MAALAHLGVGLAAKHVTPKTPLYVLILSAWVIDIIWSIFFFAGIEYSPQPGGIPKVNPWSHSLFMSFVWSVMAAGIAKLISRNTRSAVFIGLLVFSHWIIDFITHPMGAAIPGDPKLPLLFQGSPTVGLGLYNYNWGINIGEYGTLIAGIVIYILALRKLKKASLAKLEPIEK